MSNPLQNKMLSYSVNPPERVWENIATALDESANKFPATLYNLETTPPAATWEKIKLSLENEYQAPARRKIAWARYAAAAIVIGCIAWGGLQLIKQSATGKPINHEAAMIPHRDSSHKRTTTGLEEHSQAATAINDKKKHDDPDLPAKTNPVSPIENSMHLQDIVNEAADHPAYAVLHDNGNNEPNTEHTGLAYNTASRYVMLTTPDGNVVRLSKKLGDMMCCVSGEEQDASCRDQLQKWREKIACAPVNASPGNFMDIITLVNSLQQNTD